MNRTVRLVRYAKLDSGWRRGAVVMLGNGRIKHPYMMYAGAETEAPEGRYQLLRYDGNKPAYTDVGNNPTEALSRLKAQQGKAAAHVEAVVAAKKAGLEIAESIQRRAEQPAQSKTLRQYATAYIKMHESLPHRSDDSIRVYRQVTSTFLAQCEAAYPEKITREDVIRWHGWMRNEQGYSDRTACDRYKALRGWLRYCGVDPAKIIDRGTHKMLRQYTRRIPNAYTPEVVDALIAASTDSNRALLWEFAYKTGLRDSELQHVTRHDLHGLDTDSPTLHVRERDEYGRIKDAEERTVELHPALAVKLNAWLKANPERRLVFGTINDKCDTKMLLALKVTARRAGLNCGQCSGCQKRNECREYTLHRFRRTFVSRMLVATHGDLRSVMQRSGHSDLASVMRYLAPTSHIRQAVAHAF